MVRGKIAGTLHDMVKLVDDDKRQSSLLAALMEVILLFTVSELVSSNTYS